MSTQVFNDTPYHTLTLKHRTLRLLPNTLVDMTQHEIMLIKKQLSEMETYVKLIPEIDSFMKKQVCKVNTTRQ